MSGRQQRPLKMSSKENRKAADKIVVLAAAFLFLTILLCGCGGKETERDGKLPGEETAEAAGSECHLRDGVYSIQADSSSSMFRVTQCSLQVDGGQMRAVMTLGGTGYLKLFMGTAEEAAAAPDEECIPYQTNDKGEYTYTVPVEALDEPVACAAYSRRKETWYDRTLIFRSDSLPLEAFAEGAIVTAESLELTDGIYEVQVELKGGSGRASIDSPARMRIQDQKAEAVIAWGSDSYDYMKVDSVRYEAQVVEGQSVFTIPVACFDRDLPVTANTIAMSEPHEIQYSLRFDSGSIRPVKEEGEENTGGNGQRISWSQMRPSASMSLSYASQFTVDLYEGGFRLLSIGDGSRYLVVPQGQEVPEGLDEEIQVLRQPLDRIYLVATSAMDLFRSLDSLDQIRLSGTRTEGWHIVEARQAMEEGRILYAGKYNAPDYELIYGEGCDLAVESTMIYHSPEVKERLEELEIPVLVERSSYESHPLGRMEWLKLYGVLLGKEELAQEIFDKNMERLEDVLSQPATGKTVAFFYINSNGSVNVRKSGDYVAEMIRMAGGTYVFQNLAEENALSTMNMQMEDFYLGAKDADVLIYNSTIDGQLETVDELLAKSGLLADFKAVREGNVWCTRENLFQSAMGLGDMILDIHAVLTDHQPRNLTYLYRLN